MGLDKLTSKACIYGILKKAVFEAIEKYNNTPHGGERMFFASPVLMDQALKTYPPVIKRPVLTNSSFGRS